MRFPGYGQVMKFTRISLEEYRFSVSTVAFNGVFQVQRRGGRGYLGIYHFPATLVSRPGSYVALTGLIACIESNLVSSLEVIALLERKGGGERTHRKDGLDSTTGIFKNIKGEAMHFQLKAN